MKRRVVLLGPPGSGKGTVAQRLETDFGLEHVSTGQWFRREMEQGTELGEQVREIIVCGELVPDQVVVGLMHHWLTPDLIEHGYLFDGFPRTLPQARALDEFCREKNAPLDVVLCLTCPESEILKRVGGRRACLTCGKVYNVHYLPPAKAGICDACGSALAQRDDDREDVVKSRLEFYRKITEPLVDYYQKGGKLVSLNAALGSDAAYQLAKQALES